VDARIGLRLTEEDQELLVALVRAANHRAKGLGLPAEITPSSLVRALIRGAAETQGIASGDLAEEPVQQVRRAPNVQAALRKLRESKGKRCR
jgi:hypothetical protein